MGFLRVLLILKGGLRSEGKVHADEKGRLGRLGRERGGDVTI